MTGPQLTQGGRVGVPGPGERVCPECDGTGHDRERGHQLMGGCDNCDATGVVPELRVGDRVPMPPKPKLKVRPASWVDSPAKGPRGAFTNGRGKAP